MTDPQTPHPYPQPHPHPQPGHAVGAQHGGSQDGGALPYGLGFLAFLPIPFVNFLVAGVAMAAVRGRQRRRGPVAAENARHAANWGLTLIAVLVLLVGLAVILANVLPPRPGEFQVALLPIAGVLVFGVLHLVVIIRGLTHAGRGEVFVNRLAVPFLAPGRSVD